MKKKLMALVLALALVFGLAACGGTTAEEEPQETGEESQQQSYTVGVCQLIQHEALDAATEGFKAALEEKLGDAVTVEVQNAAGDSPTCATICNTFVSNGYDLIMANATASVQAAASRNQQHSDPRHRGD